MAHGLTQAGHLDLNYFRAQLAQIGGGRRTQDVLGAGEAPIAFQALGFFCKRVFVEYGFTIFFKG